MCCRPVEENVDFLTDLEKAAEGKGVIVMCEAGGTMKPSPNFASGKASRSLKVRRRLLLGVPPCCRLVYTLSDRPSI